MAQRAFSQGTTGETAGGLGVEVCTSGCSGTQAARRESGRKVLRTWADLDVWMCEVKKGEEVLIFVALAALWEAGRHLPRFPAKEPVAFEFPPRFHPEAGGYPRQWLVH